MHPRGFFSYARDDDAHLGKRLTELKGRIAGEVSMLLGGDVAMFQDIFDLRAGDRWEEKLRAAISSATFLVPVLTPRYFTRPWCREETLTFLRLATEMGVTPLVFPVLFVDLDGSDPEDDEVRAALAPFQHQDFRQWRFMSAPSEREQLENTYARAIVARLRETAKPTPVAKASSGRKPAPVRKTASRSKATGEVRAETAAMPETTAGSAGGSSPTYPILTVDPFLGRADHTSIQAAIEAATPGSRILIRPGTYHEALRLSKPLELIGDGDQGRIVVTTGQGVTLHCDAPMARVVGLTLRRESGGENTALWITAGNAEIEDCVVTSHSLAGVEITFTGTAPTLRRCRLVDGSRSGLFVHSGASPSLEDCEFVHNGLSGAQIKGEGTRAIFTRCVARDNAEGGFAFGDKAVGRLDGCRATGHGFSGSEVAGSAAPQARDCHFNDNKWAGLLIARGGRGRFDACTIAGNEHAGVVVSDASRVDLRASTVTGNGYQAIWIADAESGGTFENNDLTGNQRGAWDIAKGAEAKVVRTNNKE